MLQLPLEYANPEGTYWKKYQSRSKFSITWVDLGCFRHKYIDFEDIEFGCLK